MEMMKNRPENAGDFCTRAVRIFNEAIEDYHIQDSIDAEDLNRYEFKTIEYYLYLKCWIDTLQWHMEDMIRDPNIDPEEALRIKRRMDRCNQDRTDVVELIDSYFLEVFQDVEVKPDATINTESPAWALDRLSILQLKLYHMRIELKRREACDEEALSVRTKLSVLEDQNGDLITAITQLLEAMGRGEKYMKVYKQMKMYNDPTLNPVLYGKGLSM